MTMHRAALLAGVAGTVLLAGNAAAELTEIEITATSPFAEGTSFGTAGPYIRVKGVARGELDPEAPENAVIVNIDAAPRNAQGLVEYEVDFDILRPEDMSESSGTLLYEVTNRGRKFLLHWLNEAAATSPAAVNEPETLDHAGNGFAFERGHTLVWSGWDPDAPTANGGLAARFPVAMRDGEPLVETIRDEIVVGTRGPAEVEVARLSYPAVAQDTAKARLTVRARERDARQEIPASDWEFADARSIRLLPEGTRFEPGKIYEIWYDATDAKVLGIGYAATRDLVSFLRYAEQDRVGTRNPLISADAEESRIERALAIGISQSGRYLRPHVELGMNRDEQGRKVFDGLHVHIAGAGKVFANHAFGQPGRTATQHEDRFYPESWFPLAYGRLTDPITGQTAGLFRNDGSDPLVIETNTSTEYWQKGASLVHTDPAGLREAGVPEGVRVYLIAGTQHGGRVGLTDAPGACANPRNPHNPGPALRALLVALEEWVTDGTEPPASLVPRVADGSAVAAAAITFPKIPDMAVAADGNRLGPAGDWVNPPSDVGRAYRSLVSAIDEDGNETSGIRLPPIAAPLGTYTGWNLYKADEIAGELCDRDGSFMGFAKTRSERDAGGDPRLSLEERYETPAGYVSAVREAADALVQQRLLLPADAEAYVRAAEQVSF
jgi:hypothetical protein